jgi:hypothetical protein
MEVFVSFAKYKLVSILLSSLENYSKKHNNKMTQLKYIGYCGVDYL